MIELNNLTTGYSKEIVIHRGLNYQFTNQIYGILGESGCGKTTLLRTISGLLKPLGGEVLINGEKLKKAGKNGVYMMHQNYTCFNWMKCIDNVLIGKKIKSKLTDADVKNAEEMLEQVGLLEYRGRYPPEMSGGQRQRLALARTLFTKPDILLMDETLSALDENTRTEMQEIILALHRQTNNTIIMVTHSKKEANKMCDTIISL